jgi:hypothetical protein
MDLSYIAPKILISKSIATEEAFLEHTRKAHAALARYYFIKGKGGASDHDIKSTLELLGKTMV